MSLNSTSETAGSGSAGYLGLILDHQRYTARREGVAAEVDFRGQKRLWDLLMALERCNSGYCAVSHLIHAVWEDYPADVTTVYSTVSDLRKALAALKLTVTSTRHLGYQLAVMIDDNV